jgi:hypothetical protein
MFLSVHAMIGCKSDDRVVSPYDIFYFHSVDPYRITKSIWAWKWSYLLKKSRSEVNIKVYNNFIY